MFMFVNIHVSNMCSYKLTSCVCILRILKVYFGSNMIVCVCVCVCERERERENV